MNRTRVATLLAIVIAGFAFGETASAERPNILFCIADDASQPHFGAYGCQWVRTPAFDRVARDGLLFTNAWTPNAKCAPSRACILTGRNTWQLEAACNHMCYFPRKFITYVEALTEAGYFTGKTAKGWSPGVAVDENGNRRALAGKAFDKRKLKPPARFITNTDYAGNFEDFLEARPDGKRFCFWYGCREPHRRYEYGVGIEKGGKKPSDIDRVPGFWPDNKTIRTDMLDYAYEVEYFDRHLGRMLKTLEDRGELENTLVVVTSDNGMPFPRVKGQEYAMSNHLPLAIMWPKGIKKPGRTIDDFVSFIDFAPTFLEVAEVAASKTKMQPITGQSLTQVFGSAKSGRALARRDHMLIGKERHDVGRPDDQGYPIRGIVKDGYLYLRNYEPSRWPVCDPVTGYLNCDGSPTKTAILNLWRSGKAPRFWDLSFARKPAEELYFIQEDRECLHNLAGDPKHAAVKQALEKQMVAELRAQRDPRMFGKGHIFDEYPVATKPVANYFNRFAKGEKVKAGWVNPGDYETKPVD